MDIANLSKLLWPAVEQQLMPKAPKGKKPQWKKEFEQFEIARALSRSSKKPWDIFDCVFKKYKPGNKCQVANAVPASLGGERPARQQQCWSSQLVLQVHQRVDIDSNFAAHATNNLPGFKGATLSLEKIMPPLEMRSARLFHEPEEENDFLFEKDGLQPQLELNFAGNAAEDEAIPTPPSRSRPYVHTPATGQRRYDATPNSVWSFRPAFPSSPVAKPTPSRGGRMPDTAAPPSKSPSFSPIANLIPMRTAMPYAQTTPFQES